GPSPRAHLPPDDEVDVLRNELHGAIGQGGIDASWVFASRSNFFVPPGVRTPRIAPVRVGGFRIETVVMVTADVIRTGVVERVGLSVRARPHHAVIIESIRRIIVAVDRAADVTVRNLT